MGKIIKWTVIIAIVVVAIYSLYHMLKSRGESQAEAKEA